MDGTSKGVVVVVVGMAADKWRDDQETREYEANAKIQLLVNVYGRKLDMVGTETSQSDTVADHYYVSSDFSETHCKSVRLTLLSGSP